MIMLYSPGNEVLPIVIFRVYTNGEFTVLAGTGVLMIAVLLAIVLIAYRVGVRVGVDTEGNR